MFSPRLFSLFAFATFISLAVSQDDDNTCHSYGVDFVGGEHYFINTLSNDSFTCVSTFDSQCQPDLADILLVDPNGEEYLCSEIPTTPADTPELSTCPILKSQMISGDYIILVLGNNADGGNPFAWERDISLDCGPQATTTVTPTVTFNITSTPTITSTSTSTVKITTSIGPTATFTIPSATANETETVTPTAVTTTSTKTFTRHRVTRTKDLRIITKTVTASCTVPPKPEYPDKPCTYSPTLLHPAALVTPTAPPSYQGYGYKGNRKVDFGYARGRIQAAKHQRDQKAKAKAAAPLKERAPDAPTITITAHTPINTTATYTAAAITTVEPTLATITATTTLPPVTIYSGVFTSVTTITLPTPTKTRLAFTFTTAWTTKTIRATWTRTTTITPLASATACKRLGGHVGSGRL